VIVRYAVDQFTVRINAGHGRRLADRDGEYLLLLGKFLLP
jgi:hypothetical protein